MSALYPNNLLDYADILMVLLRLMGFFLLVPAFSNNAIPPTVKILFAFAISLAIYPVVKGLLGPLPMTMEGIAFVALRETAVGFLMGFTAYLTFEALNLASQFIGYQMGFGTAGLIDPQNHAHVSVLVSFQGWIILMVFFFMDMHHQLLHVFVMSFRLTHGFTSDLLISDSLYKTMVTLTSGLFTVAIQLAAPFTFLVLACNVGIGILARLLPQMNIILFSFPITITLSFVALYLLAPEMMEFFEVQLNQISGEIATVLRTI